MREFVNVLLHSASLLGIFLGFLFIITEIIQLKFAFLLFFCSIFLWFFIDWIEEYFEKEEEKEKGRKKK